MTTLLGYAQGCDNLVTTLLCGNMVVATLGFLYGSSPVTAAVDDPLSGEQLHAHGYYQNVTEHKTSDHGI